MELLLQARERWSEQPTPLQAPGRASVAHRGAHEWVRRRCRPQDKQCAQGPLTLLSIVHAGSLSQVPGHCAGC